MANCNSYVNLPEGIVRKTMTNIEKTEGLLGSQMDVSKNGGSPSHHMPWVFKFIYTKSWSFMTWHDLAVSPFEETSKCGEHILYMGAQQHMAHVYIYIYVSVTSA